MSSSRRVVYSNAFRSSDAYISALSCGSYPGNSSAHVAAARSLAEVFHKRGIRLVYGGGTVGIMGELARTLVSLAGPDAVHGVIPAPLVRYERSTAGAFPTDHPTPNAPTTDGASEGAVTTDAVQVAAEANSAAVGAGHYSTFGRTTVVPDMHARKALMAREVLAGGPGSGFAALSGGYGTLEELMEVTTWNVLGIHDRGVCVYNVEGYWDGLLAWVKGAVGVGFVAEGNRDIIVEARTAEEVVERLKAYEVASGRFNLDWNQT